MRGLPCLFMRSENLSGIGLRFREHNSATISIRVSHSLGRSEFRFFSAALSGILGLLSAVNPYACEMKPRRKDRGLRRATQSKLQLEHYRLEWLA